MIKYFLSEPLWFKLLVGTMLLLSILFSSSLVPDHPYYEGGSKLAAAVFFTAYGINMRRNRKISLIFAALAVVSLILSWRNFQ
ncbi:hypothetical protein GCM10010912_52960 [Paenibacillus albidus]|uniref:Uncharacterized protein n=1 Tax=Paenibacillus albidus TaxID=2041023 RepID=A0A917CY00_9BACL|nr:hypothetical protein [Paenibacillus albidus]GGG01523.1 hypothetical protein GCM10010912_52960 [Paenibacillus albidus]